MHTLNPQRTELLPHRLTDHLHARPAAPVRREFGVRPQRAQRACEDDGALLLAAVS